MEKGFIIKETHKIMYTSVYAHFRSTPPFLLTLLLLLLLLLLLFYQRKLINCYVYLCLSLSSVGSTCWKSHT